MKRATEEQGGEPRSLAVDEPIVNDPYEEPGRYWEYREGQPALVEGRRPAGYYMAPRTRARAGTVAEEEFVALGTVNEIRKRVERWRNAGYPGATQITKELLAHWNSPEREGRQRLFFCQREAAETMIWLVEGPEAEKQGLEIPFDEPHDAESIEKGYKGLRRYCCKMATASGKTVVMAMIIAWSVLNKVYNPKDRRFSDGVLVLCPNLTVKERLGVLYPTNGENYYEEFDVVPRSLLDGLGRGNYLVTNWHAFIPQDDEGKRGVVKRGAESDGAFCKRVLSRLANKENLLVLNDEAHHAYRPAPAMPDQPELFAKLPAEERKRLEAETKAAKVWVGGLDRINSVRRINFCLDLSATPFHLKGSGYAEGSPLGSTPDRMDQSWIVSDFGLVDAVESGIVKIPRVPVDDNTGRPLPDYFHLWRRIMERLPAGERATARRKPKPEAVLLQAEGALETLTAQWKATFEDFRASGYKVPPAMIVVCNNTDLSEVVAEFIGKTGGFPELRNTDEQQPTFRIDSKLLEKAESVVEAPTREDAAQRLREIATTVGKEGKPGEQVRCVVSVGMLTEGWDAHNVTQILGLRAFDSQLLCEQVVGRGLRRTNYDELHVPEYVDVYGIPFEVIPVKKASLGPKRPPKPSTLVKALPERKEKFEITFPRVEGYIFDVRHRVKADISSIPQLYVEPQREPTEVIVKDAVGYRLGHPDRLGPGEEVVQDRELFHQLQRRQSVEYQIAAAVTHQLKEEARRILFPQVLKIVRDYVARRVIVAPGAPLEDIALLRYREEIVSRLCNAIEPDTEAGEAPVLPRIERFRPKGSTSEVLFRTTRPCYGTTKSHVSHVVVDDRSWEHSVAYQLERLPSVVSYVKNDHLDFTMPYEFERHRHSYTPDFLIRLSKKNAGELTVIVEVKGYEAEQDRGKESGARRWISAVNHHGGFGEWALAVCRDPRRLGEALEQ